MEFHGYQVLRGDRGRQNYIGLLPEGNLLVRLALLPKGIGLSAVLTKNCNPLNVSWTFSLLDYALNCLDVDKGRRGNGFQETMLKRIPATNVGDTNEASALMRVPNELSDVVLGEKEIKLDHSKALKILNFGYVLCEKILNNYTISQIPKSIRPNQIPFNSLNNPQLLRELTNLSAHRISQVDQIGESLVRYTTSTIP